MHASLMLSFTEIGRQIRALIHLRASVECELPEPLFTKLKLSRQRFAKIYYSEFHENSTNGLVS